MELGRNQLLLLQEIAISAALQAGSLIKGYDRTKLQVNRKEGGKSLASQVVTEVDCMSEEIIKNTLAASMEKFDIALLTEESVDDKSRFEKDYFWCVDPLDGTLPFTEGIAGYSVSIALVKNDGTPVLGVIYDPVKDALYSAVESEGAFINGKKYTIPEHTPDAPAYFIHDRSFVDYKHYTVLHDFLKGYFKNNENRHMEIIQQGGAAMNACWVMEHSVATYFKFPKKADGGGSLWDYAASACIFTEAGGVVCNVYGEKLDLNRKDSTFMNHQGAIYATNQTLAQAVIDLYKEGENW